jgi:DNA-binding transcriptional regulator YiaG
VQLPINPKEARLKLGLNQSQMARLMGVHRSTWVKWERGERRMNAAAVELLRRLTKRRRNIYDPDNPLDSR